MTAERADTGDATWERVAYGYLSLPRTPKGDAETRLRWSLLEYARLEGLDLRRVFVDSRDDDGAYGFDALRVVLARKPDVRAVILPDLTHVAHIPLVATMTSSELSRLLGVAVRLTVPEATPPLPGTQPLAVGLVHRAAGTPTPDRMCARAVVVRYARDAQLQLHRRPRARRPGGPHASGPVPAQRTGVDLAGRRPGHRRTDANLARRLADDLGLEHHAVPTGGLPSCGG